jgi:arylsulfatase A-like enzyme/Tfp pilus assembly protein PilF
MTRRLYAFVAALLPMAVTIWFLLFASASDTHKPLNVLLISIDTLRADHLGCYGYKVRTPAIDSFAAGAVLFETAISQVPQTLPSHATILTGLYPDQHGIRNNESFILESKFKTLAEEFREHSYQTGAIVGSFSLDSTFGLNQGFQFYEDRMGQVEDISANRYLERKAEKVRQIAEKWLSGTKSPWFCFVHFFDPHAAYHPPDPFPKTYDGEIAYTDQAVGSLLKFLSDTGKINTTIIVLLSDHGESLGEHGEASHGVFLYDSTLRVPLIIQSPGFKATRISQQVRLVDVAPTLLQLAGVSQTKWKVSGESLVPLMEGGRKELPAYSETYYTNLLMGWAPLQSLRWSSKKYIEAPRPELYDLSRDPQELKNLYTSSSVPAAVRNELNKHRFTTAPSTGQPLDPEVREKLASLGYVTGGSSTPVSSSYDPKDGIAIWDRIERAVQAAQTGNLDRSAQLLQEVLKIQPSNIMAEKILANVLVKQGDTEQAIRLLKNALRSELQQKETQFDLAAVYFERKEYPQALEQLEAVLKLEPTNIRALELAAECYLQTKRYPDAAELYERLLQLNPSDPESWSRYARVLSFLQRDQDALNAYLRLSELRPLSDQELVQVAAIYLTEKNTSKAEENFRKAIEQNPNSSQAWGGIALIQLSRGKTKEALEAFLNAGNCSGARRVIDQDQNLPAQSVRMFEQKCSGKSNP